MKARFILPLVAVPLCVGATLAAESTKDATPATQQANADLLKTLPMSDRQDYEDAKRGFIATLPDINIKTPDGKVVWTLNGYQFLQAQDAPPTVNPSLYRNSQLNMNNGLYKVTDGIYQIRGFDLSVMSIVETNNGIIVIDPLISTEVAKAGLDLYYQHRPKKPVVAVIYTHSHVDHYGGVKGVVNEADVKSGKVKIFAPEGFLEEAVSENVFAGNAMSRRAIYMYGSLLPRSAQGQVDGGLGKTTSNGTVTLIPPTDIITKTGEKRTIDGLDVVFQMAPGTEAPAEMLFYFPKYHALCAAEDATHTLHNLYTLRGAQVRDANKWWQALNTTIDMFGPQVQVVFASHHWPMWDNARVNDYLAKQRDTYKYVHDQSLRLLNMGYTMDEIGDMVKLPPSLDKEWYNHGYYGTVVHDAKAVYQRYMGWYSGNPADLHPLPPVETAKRTMDFMGGVPAVMKKAQDAYAKGDYRWVAQVMNMAVYAEPDNQDAKNLEADALEQLGYQSESGPWRDVYLMGAYELRNGIPKVPAVQTASPDTIRAMTPEMALQFLSMHIDGDKADGKKISVNWIFPDIKKQYSVRLENSVLVYNEGKQMQNADVTLTLPKSSLDNIMLHQTNLDKEVEAGRAKVDGDRGKISELLSLTDTFNPLFPIVTPRPPAQ
ncbi:MULTISPECIES: alkyl/aryl-sulfatase [unclassified Caballeronia]|uniref:alkyl/aryl-sulfatase n=1 Tax=unclassified Caballeronia TaxID=2646786 RepID=UPI001F22C665|nr:MULTISPECIES: alkyl sulfatase dimerization domain-containing protein [unclassified Caballeronia]MCE4546039.1 MBL fold metallo-hydrolase [Caballeronia sp. PC1]MCE4573488.1 MBL fold metallo-hydrolase [Caballeronia sp. CLC5]